MAGHNKWSKVKRLKAVTDARKGKVFSRLSRDITMAAKGGGGDPAANARLRTLLLKAREANMPADNIDRAIKKGTGELPGVVFEELHYEGYGPGGVAFIVLATTDNKQRTAQIVRSIFANHGGNLAQNGAVAFQFLHAGQFLIPREQTSEDKLLEIVLANDGPPLDAALSALQRIADTPEAHVQVARQQERLQVRRSEFGLAARTLEDAWRRYSAALDEESELQLRIDLGYALLSAARNTDARRICESIDRAALRDRDPALQIRALRLLVRELDARGSDRDALIRTIGDWRRTAEQLYGSDSLEAAKAYVWSVGVITDPQEQDVLMRKAYAIQTAKLPPVSTARAYAEYNMAGFYLEYRHPAELAEPHLARAVQIGRKASSRAHADVRKFELTWAETLNRLGRHRECIDRLSAPPGEPDDAVDAEALSGLRLELAKAAAALRRPEDARKEIAAVEALWREIGKPLPAALAGTLRSLKTGLEPGADER